MSDVCGMGLGLVGHVSDVQRGGPWLGPGILYSEALCIMSNCHMGPHPPMNRQTDTSENITFPQLRWQAAMK